MDVKPIFLIVFILSLILLFSAKMLDSMLASVAGLHLALLSSALYFVYGTSFSTFLSNIGIPGNLKKNITYTIVGLVALFTALFLLSVLFAVVGYNDQDKVVDVAKGLPIYIIALAIVLAPITEELFFRAFLSPRIGIFFSALVFGLFHFAYGSVVEIAGAFFIGLIFAWMYKKSGSVIPCMIVHLLYNSLAIIVMRGFS